MISKRPIDGVGRALPAVLALCAVLVLWAVLVLSGAAGLGCATKGSEGLPAADSDAYEETARLFFRALAHLEVGLQDAAIEELGRATELAPGEPATWANLGLTHLRLGAFDLAAAAIERAAALAPESGEVAFLQGRLETARGRRDEAIVHLRRAVELDPANLQARTALIQEIENAAGPDADAEAQRLLEELVALRPDNAALLVERARLAAKRADAALLQDSVSRLERFAAGWPPEVIEQYRSVQATSAAGDFTGAARAIAFLRNVLVRVPSFLEGRRIVTPSGELIADPFTRFLHLPTPSATPSPADVALSFSRDPIAEAGATTSSAVLAISLDGEAPPTVFAADAREVHRLGATGPALPFPSGTEGAPPSASGLVALDWSYDFRMDLALVGAGGVRLFLQSDDGTFTDATALASAKSGPLDLDATGAWVADIEMDGDLDLVVGVRGEAPVVLRNNGDGTWEPTAPFAGVVGLLGFAWGDLDHDGDPDAALLDGSGELHVLANLQAGRFDRIAAPDVHTGMVALALGDSDADGGLDLVTLDAGTIRRASLDTEGSSQEGGWSQEKLVTWPGAEGTGAEGAVAGETRLILADLDNNGALDLVASAAQRTGLWLAGEDLVLQPLAAGVDAEVWSVADLDGDGQLDLLGLASGRPVLLLGEGTLGHHYQVVRPRAVSSAGDQRINSFGIGGIVEVRSGRLVQKQTISGPVLHFGLGTRTNADVTRIVWPNGVAQAEFDPGIDRAIVAEQRLKGSCPWVFAYDGSGMRFVTDFLWRSPLGLRINAQDTAGVTQTEDWVKIRGDQLVPQDGAYDVRISAELWETHFVDHVSLLVVDHPEDLEVFVDERFVPGAEPALRVHATRPPRAVLGAWDQAGRDVTDLIHERDGRYLGAFERGRYQGIAEEHFVEVDLGVELGVELAREKPLWLVAHGFLYPTDSSINVAIGQGGHVRPQSLSLEAQDARGHWVNVKSELGFPAGKNKTILLDLGLVERAGVVGARRLRLRTNLEIYWDSLAVAEGVSDASLLTQRLHPAIADLRYRGFSVTRSERRDQPEIPIYDRIANITPRWRDLVGYYTRFGDVRELLAEVEDRYVIMNAGDELRLSFSAPPPPAPGWVRDFVLIGDGWVKDGDFNTSFSKTVLPLPAHDEPDYRASSPTPSLEADPVYRRYAADWQDFHTRFVAPSEFLEGLELAELPRALRRQP